MIKQCIKIINFTDWSHKKGVYGIYNIINNKIYIGSSNTLCHRLTFHRRRLRRGNHPHAVHLQNAWNKHGESNFKFLIIEELPSTVIKEEIINREQYWIDYYNASNSEFGYNTCSKAYSCLGIKQSDETKQKMSKSHKGEKNHFYGKHHSEDVKKKMSKAKLGKKPLLESKIKIREAKKCKFKAPWEVNLGDQFGRYITTSLPFQDEKNRWKIKAKCQCGKEKTVTVYDLLMSKTVSCGCFAIDKNRSLKKGKSIYKGVSRKHKKWEVRLHIPNNIMIRCGIFSDLVEAAEHYDYYAIKHLGFNCYLNFPDKDYSNFQPKSGSFPISKRTSKT
jgi:group I intron endonuclease